MSYRQKITCLKKGILKGSHITRWSIVNKVEHFRRCSISWQFFFYFPKNSITSVWLTVLNLLFENVPLCIFVDYYPFFLITYLVPFLIFILTVPVWSPKKIQNNNLLHIYIYILKKELAESGQDYKWLTSKYVNRFVVLWHWWSSIHKEV